MVYFQCVNWACFFSGRRLKYWANLLKSTSTVLQKQETWGFCCLIFIYQTWGGTGTQTRDFDSRTKKFTAFTPTAGYLFLSSLKSATIHRFFTFILMTHSESKWSIKGYYLQSNKHNYEDELIIIRNAVAFVFLLVALSFSSYHSCAGLKSLGQFLCSNRNVNRGRSTFRLHQGRAAFTDQFFVVWRCIRGRNTSKTSSTILEQCFAVTGCLRMDRKIQKWSHKC